MVCSTQRKVRIHSLIVPCKGHDRLIFFWGVLEPDYTPVSDSHTAPDTRVPSPPPLPPPRSSEFSRHDFGGNYDSDTFDPGNYWRPWRVANAPPSRTTFADRVTTYPPVESRGLSNEAAPTRRPLPSARMRSSSPFLGSSMWSDVPGFALFDDGSSFSLRLILHVRENLYI